MLKNNSIIKFDGHYSYGQNVVTTSEDSYKTGLNFSILRLKKDQGYSLGNKSTLETVLLLMTGYVHFQYGNNKSRKAFRTSYFDQMPYALHTSSRDTARVVALTDCEIMIIQTHNKKCFQSVFFDGDNIADSDSRGKGFLNNSSHRLVKTIFDKRNRPESNIVVGEIITFSGNWSSYPSHFHEHPEIYYYRFSEPKGFAFGENGKEVNRIMHNDTMVITDKKVHAHVTAPGYCLYTLWFIRHLKDNPYTSPTFQKEYNWTRFKESDDRVWVSINGY